MPCDRPFADCRLDTLPRPAGARPGLADSESDKPALVHSLSAGPSAPRPFSQASGMTDEHARWQRGKRDD